MGRKIRIAMNARELFKDCNSYPERKTKLIEYGKKLYTSLNRSLKVNDFRGGGKVSTQTVYKYFDSLNNYFIACGSTPNTRARSMSKEEFKKFLLSIREVTEKNCWITSYFKNKKERPQIKYRGRTIFLHRVSFSLWKEDPKNKLLLHSCDNPKCFNPKHLRIGTQVENMRDAVERNRWATGKWTRKRHKIKDPYDYKAILEFITENSVISDKNEFLFKGPLINSGYVKLCINKRHYLLHRLILANKLGKDYDKSYKLTSEEVKQIKIMLEFTSFLTRGSKKKFDERWAKKFSVSPITIADIRRGKSWRNI